MSNARAAAMLLALGATLSGAALLPARAADATACRELEAHFDAGRAGLAAPEVSAFLFHAADDGCEALAARLLDAGASVAARDREGGTALTHAARSGQRGLVKLLVAHGAEINQRNVKGATPLAAAVEHDRLGAAQDLIGLGADVNLPGQGGVAPLAAAAYNGDAKLVDLLVGHGADPSARDATGKTALLYAAARGFAPVVKRLLATGIDINARYSNDLTVLMWAAGYADDVPVDDGVGLVTALLDGGAALEAVDDRGRTALMTAAELGHDEVVDLLLRRGAKPDLRDKQGKTAADLAASEALRAKLH